MKLMVTFFGPLSDSIARQLSFDIPAQIATIADLREHLAARYPEASEQLRSDRTRCIVDGQIAAEQLPLAGIDQLEFFPPVSGG